MKKSFFYRFMVLSIGALLAGVIACKNPASPEPVTPEQNIQTPGGGTGGGGTPNPGGGGGSGGGGGGPTPTPNPVNLQTDQEKVEAAKAALKLRVNGKVSGWISLPRRGPYEVDISWTSSPSGIIDTNGQVTRPEDDTEVTLTATITKGAASATKTSTVTVYGKNQEMVDRAVQQISQPPAFVMGNPAPPLSLEPSKRIITGPNPTTDYIEIPLTWKAEPEDIIDASGAVTQPAEKKRVTLTATLSKGGQSESKQKEVTVKARTKFDNCELTGDLLTMKGDGGQVTAVYRVQIDADAKKITATAEQAVYNGILMTLDAIRTQQLAQIDPMVQFYRSLLSLCDKQTVTLQDLKDANAQQSPEYATMSDEDIFNEVVDSPYSYADFVTKSAEEKTQIIKEHYLNPTKKSVYHEFHIPQGTPLEQALAQAKEQQTARINARIENAKKQRTYTYGAENYNNELYTHALYVTGTPWYQQHGDYSYNEWNGPDIQEISLFSRIEGNGKYHVSISIRKKGTLHYSFQASGYDGSGAITAKTRDGTKQIIVTVTEKASGKVEVACAGEVSFTKELTFRGKPIPTNPLWN